MDGRERNSRTISDLGFTLIEVTFAVLILAGSLVTLLGLQSSSLQLATHDKYTQQAMLIARQIMAPIETSKDPIDIQDNEGSVASILEKVLPNLGSSGNALPQSQDFRARLKVEYWGIPKVDEQATKRITLTISWSPSTDDQFQLIYFMPNEGDQTDPQAAAP